LERLGRRAHEGDEARIACLCDHCSVLDRDRVDAVDRLGQSPTTHGYPDWLDALEPKGRLNA
jgi:hypothetical protein